MKADKCSRDILPAVFPPLTPSPARPHANPITNVGSIELHLPISTFFSVVPRTQVSVTVVSAKGLARADVFGKSDPFVIVFLNRRELGRTRPMFKTLDPCWTDPKETFPVRLAGDQARCKLVVQVWDEDLGGCRGV